MICLLNMAIFHGNDSITSRLYLIFLTFSRTCHDWLPIVHSAFSNGGGRHQRQHRRKVQLGTPNTSVTGSLQADHKDPGVKTRPYIYIYIYVRLCYINQSNICIYNLYLSKDMCMFVYNRKYISYVPYSCLIKLLTMTVITILSVLIIVL